MPNTYFIRTFCLFESTLPEDHQASGSDSRQIISIRHSSDAAMAGISFGNLLRPGESISWGLFSAFCEFHGGETLKIFNQVDSGAKNPKSRFITKNAPS